MAFDISLIQESSAKGIILKSITIIGIISTIFSLFSPNPLLCVPAFVSLYFIVYNLYVSKYLVGFLVAFVYQWFQVSIKILYACYTFQDVQNLTQYPDHILKCYLLCSLGIIIITYAISIFIKRAKFNDQTIFNLINKFNLNRLLISYFMIGIIAHMLPLSLSQLAIQLAAFKWGIFYIIFLLFYNKERGKWIILALVSFEFVLGFASYFSSWKDVVFYTLISVLTVIKLTPKRIFILGLASVALFYIGLFWTGIKGEYRTYIAQGSTQAMMVSKADAINKIFDLGSNFKVNDNVTKSFIDRISYIDYLSACMNHVPNIVPHENGKLTINAITHVLIPRVVNKNKAVIDESTHLTKYTGVFFSNLSMGVSFSLGYFGDFYVDFGEIGMLIAILCMGFFIGWIFLNVYNHIQNPIIGIAVMQMSFILLYKFEISLIKLVGTIVTFWILYRLLAAYIFPKYSKWIMNE